MSFDKLLENACFAPQLDGQTKNEIISEIVDLLHCSGKVTDKQIAMDAVLEREQIMSTGMQVGLALPHGKTDAVRELTTAVSLKKEGVDFSSLDGEPSRIFVMILSPSESGNAHLEALAAFSNALKEESTRDQLLAADTPEEMKATLLSAASRKSASQ